MSWKDKFPVDARKDTDALIAALRTQLAEVKARAEAAEQQLVNANATIELLQNSDPVDAITRSLEDLKAGKVKTLDCVRGGCLQAQTTDHIRALEQRIRELTEALESAPHAHNCSAFKFDHEFVQNPDVPRQGWCCRCFYPKDHPYHVRDCDCWKSSLALDSGAAPAKPAVKYSLTTEKEQILLLAKQIEIHCPCGARPESLNTHPHVAGCPVHELIRHLGSESTSIADIYEKAVRP